MSRFQFKEGSETKGVIPLYFTDESAALNFANALYQWKICNLNGRLPRKPLLKEDQYVLMVSPEELALIHEYNEKEKPVIEQVFDVFNPFLLSAAEEVRLNFMSKPYKGVIDPTLEKKEYDEFETVVYYTPLEATKVSPDKIYYRTEVKSNALDAVALLEREGKGKKTVETRYELIIEDGPLLSDPAGGYALYTLSVDSMDNLENLSSIRDWQNAARQDIEIDTRFIVIECKGQRCLYGMDLQTEEYGQLSPVDQMGAVKLQAAITAVLKDNPPQKKLTQVNSDSEAVKDLIKYGKCFGYHPPEAQCEPQKANNAFAEITQAMKEVIDEVKSAREFRIDIQKKIETQEGPVFIESEQDMETFRARVLARLSKDTQQYFTVKGMKEYAILLADSEYNLLNERLPSEFIVRPNHGFSHSMRVASYVPLLVQHYKAHHPTKCKNMDEQDVRLLQLAMLYSVVGRETEIGFGSKAKYDLVENQFNQEIEELTVSLNQTSDFGEKQKINDQIQLLEKQKTEALRKKVAEGEEYFTYRKTSALAFLDFCENSGFAKQYCEAKGKTVTHKNLSVDFYNKMIVDLTKLGLYQGENTPGYQVAKVGKNYTLTLPTMHYYTLQLYKMSDPEYAKNLKEGVQDVITNAHSLDLMRCYTKLPSHPNSFSADKILRELMPDMTHIPTEKQKDYQDSALQVAQYAINALEATGNRMQVGLNEAGQIVDKFTSYDFSKNLPASSSVNGCVEQLAPLQSTLLNECAHTLGFESAEITKPNPLFTLSDNLPTILNCERNHSSPQKVNLQFASAEEATLFVELMVQSQLLEETYLNQTHTETIEVTQNAFKEMQGHVNYQVVTVPAVHNLEANLVNEQGEITPLALFKKGDALGRNVDITKPVDVAFNFDQLNDPIHVRPITRFYHGHTVTETALDRQILMDTSEKAITETVKDFAFEIDPDEQALDDSAYLEALDEKIQNEPKKLFVFQTADGHWWCRAKDVTGRIATVDMQYDRSLIEFQDEQEEILRRMVIHLGFYKRLYRGTRDEALPLTRQMPKNAQSKSLESQREDFLLDENTARPIAKFTDLGKPRNTIYTKKLPATLFSQKGEAHLFNPIDWTDYLPVGMLFDLNEVHLRGERFIWKTDSFSRDTFWLGNVPQQKYESYYGWGENVSLEDLKAYIEARSGSAELTEWNELLVGLTKTAMKGLFVQDPYPSSRIGMVMLYQKIKADYGIDVPLMLADGQEPPRMYLDSQLREDLALLFFAKEFNDFSAVLNPNKEGFAQRTLLDNFLADIDYPALKSRYHTIEEQVDAALKKIAMIGSTEREKAYQAGLGSDTEKREQRKKAIEQLYREAEAFHIQQTDNVQQYVSDTLSDLDNLLADPDFNPSLHDNIVIKTLCEQNTDEANEDIKNILMSKRFKLDANILQYVVQEANEEIYYFLCEEVIAKKEDEIVDALLNEAITLGFTGATEVLLANNAYPQLEQLIYAQQFNMPKITEMLLKTPSLYSVQNVIKVIHQNDPALLALFAKVHSLENALIEGKDGIVDLLLMEGVLSNYEDLQLAIKEDLKYSLRYFLEHPDLLGPDVIQQAISHDDSEVLQFLIDNMENRFTPKYQDLALAIEKNTLLFDMLLATDHFDALEIMLLAIQHNNLPLVQSILERNRYLELVAWEKVIKEDDLKVASFLLDAGFEIKDYFLIECLKSNASKLFKLLVDKAGIDFYELEDVIKSNKPAFVEVLNQNPTIVTRENLKTSIEKDSESVFNFLIQNHALLNSVDENGDHLLHFVLAQPDTKTSEIAKLLEAQSAIGNEKILFESNHEMMTPIMLAAIKYRNKEWVALLATQMGLTKEEKALYNAYTKGVLPTEKEVNLKGMDPNYIKQITATQTRVKPMLTTPQAVKGKEEQRTELIKKLIVEYIKKSKYTQACAKFNALPDKTKDTVYQELATLVTKEQLTEFGKMLSSNIKSIKATK